MKKNILLWLVVIFFWIIWFSNGAVSPQFYPNWDLWNVILQTLEDFSKMDSDAWLQEYWGYNKISWNVPVILNSLPKNDPKYNTVKNNCSTLLSRADASRSWYWTFKSKCMEPLKNAISDLTTKYMVQAAWNITPSSWPAPLNVTLNASQSYDPSNQTIPNDNYFWYYRDVDWVDREIWVGPLLNYTFRQEWKYKIHLTVRSSEKNRGYVDWSQVLDVNVLPKVADIIVYWNEKQLSTQWYNKFNVWEWQNWIRLNWAWTRPTGWRKIKSHRWVIIDSSWKVLYNYNFEWAPQTVDVKLGWIGTYKVQLHILDNLNQSVYEEYNIVLSDPVTIIKSSPEKATTSQIKTFDWSLSYTVKSRLESYKWEIYSNEKKIETLNQKSFQKQFSTPWNYKVVLTTKNTAWEVWTDELNFEILSTSPNASFTVQPVRKREKPSQFVLDASSTSDYDMQNSNDSLTYKWEILDDPSAWKLISRTENDKIVTIQFDKKWEHKVKLTATDRYGASSTKIIPIKVESTLRPEFVDMPKVMKIGESRTIKVTSNQTNIAYIWKADQIVWTISESDTQEIKYDKVGVYNISVTANNRNDESNTVTSRIFVAEKWSPTLVYEVVWADWKFIEKSQSCNGSWWVETYEVDRNQPFTIDTKNSINSRGWTDGLTFIYTSDWSSNISRNSSLTNYKFDWELGCKKIKIYQKEAGSPKTNEVELYFNVKNSLPKIWNVSISFPQYWDATWIGFNATNTRPLCGPGGYDPILVRVSAINARDDDWTIVRYKWYYFDEDFPEEYKEVKVTPWNLPYAVFSLPQDGNTYSFAVKVEDDEWWITDSREVVGNAGSFFCESNTTPADKPKVSLTVSNAFPKVGEKITFSAKSSVESWRKDYATTRIYKYDLDWDWVYDHISKADRVEWIYSKPWKYEPSVMATYRWLSSISTLKWNSWKTINVEKWLYADFLVATIWNSVLIKDTSYWEIESRNFCMDAQKCDDPNMNVKNKNYFIYPYSSWGNYNIRLDIVDKYWNKQTKIQKVNISSTKNSTSSNLVSLPGYKKSSKWINTIDLWNSMNNEVIFYPSGKECYVDTDLSNDSDKNWNPKDDQDIKCNVPWKVKYSPSRDEMLFWFYDWKSLQEMKINFLDFQETISSENRANYTTIRNLISEIQQCWSSSEQIEWLLSILNNLKDNIEDKAQTSSNILALKDFLEKNPNIDLPKEITDRLELLASGLTDWSVAVIDETSEIWKIKAEIVADMPQEYKSDISKSFEDYINANWDREKMKSALNSIVEKIQSAHESKKITDEQAQRIKTKICSLVQEAWIISSEWWYCSQAPQALSTSQNDITSSESSVAWKKWWIWNTILKTIWLVAWILALGFIWLVVFFAQKARRQQSKWQNKKTWTWTSTSAPMASAVEWLKFPDAKTSTTSTTTSSSTTTSATWTNTSTSNTNSSK